MNKSRVAVGLSGGVDSAVSAYLLKKQGFDISGVYLHCFDDDAPGCRGKQDRQDALSVALHLKIQFQVLDFSKQYKASVIGYFKKEYLAGRTPNPDVICNRDIKFGLLLDWCVKKGFDYLATGHYAKLIQNTRKTQKAGMSDNQNIRKPELIRLSDSPNFRFSGTPSFLSIPKDLHKDQTYFLWAVPRQNFSRILFPLADFRKQDVRSVAKFAKIPVADKPDSTGICFIGEVRVGDFLKRLGVKEKFGDVVFQPQKVGPFVAVGSHRGVWFYTIGQRHGFAINTKGLTFAPQRLDLNIPPLYVIAKDVRKNRLIVGFGPECYRDQFEVGDCNWLVSEKVRPWAKPRSDLNRLTHCLVRIRHLGDLIPCSVIGSQFSVISPKSAGFQSAGPEPTNRKPITVFLAAPQRGVAPGQSAVFYDKTGIVLGGGVIQ